MSQCLPPSPVERNLKAAFPSDTPVAIFACTRGTRREEDELDGEEAGDPSGVGVSNISSGRLNPLARSSRGQPGESNNSEGLRARTGVQISSPGPSPIPRLALRTNDARDPAIPSLMTLGDPGVVNPTTRRGGDPWLLTPDESRPRRIDAT